MITGKVFVAYTMLNKQWVEYDRTKTCQTKREAMEWLGISQEVLNRGQVKIREEKYERTI